MTRLAAVVRAPYFRRCVLLGFACAPLALLLTFLPSIGGLENWIHDWCFSWRPPRQPAARVILVGLDEPSLDELGKPLTFVSPELAQVITFLKGQKAAAIGIDLLIHPRLNDLPELQDRQSGDATRMATAIKHAGNVVLPVVLSDDDGVTEPLDHWLTKHQHNPELTDLGFINLTPDDDGLVRRQQLLARQGSQPYLHFALALYARATNAEITFEDSLRVGGRPVPLDRQGKLAINWVGPPGSFKVVPFRDVLARANDKPRAVPDFSGAIVIVGVTARNQQDLHGTPYANGNAHFLFTRGAGMTSGTEVHANVIATLADSAYLRPVPWWGSFLLLVAFGVILSLLLARIDLALGAVVVFGHHWLWKGVALVGLHYNWYVETVPMLILGLLVYVGAVIVRKWQLGDMFGTYKSRAIAQALEADPDGFEPGGETRIITVLFADIRSFTPYCNNHGPRQVVTLLNEYFRAIVPLIERHGGTLNQYMGDGIMAMFGAPVRMEVEEGARAAVEAAVQMLRAVQALEPRWEALEAKGFRIGVGIHTGEVIVGKVGSPDRLDYTGIGDTVNVAARIESANKQHGTEILISHATYNRLTSEDRKKLGCDPQARATILSGIAEPVDLHEVRP